MNTVLAGEREKDSISKEQQTKKLLNFKEIEKKFGIHRKMLAEWRSEGIGPTCIMFGRRILYERIVVENYILSKRIKTSKYSGT